MRSEQIRKPQRSGRGGGGAGGTVVEVTDYCPFGRFRAAPVNFLVYMAGNYKLSGIYSRGGV